jgi:hypothetical protein
VEERPPPPPNSDLPPRLRRTLELVYQVEGVAAARVWVWTGKVAIGIRAMPNHGAGDLLKRVESAVAPLREPNETWEFGMMDDD